MPDHHLARSPMDHCINITLLVDNAAFGDTYDEQAQEVGRILRNLADRLEANSRYLDPTYGQYPTLNDSNGNRVGSFTPTILPLS
jgi:hypothetical protein